MYTWTTTLSYVPLIQEHINQLREVFVRLRKFNLQLQSPKCEFLRREVNYLGHVITEDGVKPDRAKVECIANYPVPRNTKEIKAFLGLVGYYRKFIKDFSMKSKPLTNLLKQGQAFIWTDLCQDAFMFFRKILTEEPLLQHPDFTKPFIVTTDTSNNRGSSLARENWFGSSYRITHIEQSRKKLQYNRKGAPRNSVGRLTVWTIFIRKKICHSDRS